MTYQDVLEARGYRRALVLRTDKAPGDLVLSRTDRPAEHVPAKPNVVAMRRKGEK